VTALFVVVPLALVVSAAFLWAFVWSVKRGQLDDLSTPALRILEDDDKQMGDAASPERADTRTESPLLH
jgi:cbb3-type cytochrome oxidase maturation protein